MSDKIPSSLSERSLPKRMVAILLLACAVLPLSPLGIQLEESLGLRILFTLRGERPPPPEIVMVTIDEDTANELMLSDKIHLWPRTVHAELIDRLRHYGAAVVAMDIGFKQPTTESADTTFAKALRNAGNVILFKYLTRPKYHNQSIADSAGESLSILQAEQEVPPIPVLSRNAAAIASFVLPKRPTRVIQAGLYKQTPSGLEATMPLMALQLFLRNQRKQLFLLLEKHGADKLNRNLQSMTIETAIATTLHRSLAGDRQLTNDLLNGLASEQTLTALVSAYAMTDPLYINFYGRRHSIRNTAYQRVLSEPFPDPRLHDRFAGKVVFIGLSEQQQTRQADYYYTVFSTDDGTDISGVEISATVFANLLEASTIKPLKGWQHILLILIWGVLLCALARLGDFAYWLAGVGLAGSLYFLVSLALFKYQYLWLPLTTPLFVMIPSLVLLMLVHHYRTQQKAYSQTAETIRRYLPSHVAETLNRKLSNLHQQRELVQGVCLISDIAKFTPFAETCSPDQLHGILNDYYQILSQAIERHNGYIVNIIGDSALALWTGDELTAQIKQHACLAALTIVANLDAYQENEKPLHTCIGIHAGEISLGNLGATSHLEYAPVGDTVNTTARIEAYNRDLNTRILISDPIKTDLTVAFVTRPFGNIVLKGKKQAIALFELVEYTGNLSDLGLSPFPTGK